MVGDDINTRPALIALRMLHRFGARALSHSDCPECGTCSLADYEHRQHVCGHCGYGPWHVAVNGNEYGPPLDGSVKPYSKVVKEA